MDLTPLHTALDHLEQAAAGIAEKLAAGVTAQVDSISQNDVDGIVARVEGVAERLVGIGNPATQTAGAAPAAPAAAGNANAAWTPEHPAG